MGAVSMNRLIIIATTAVSVSSRLISCKGTYLETYIQNIGSHYEFIKTHTDKHCLEVSKATTLVGTCKDTPWLQVACTVALSTPDIIGIYEATKNHLISHVQDNTIAGRSGASIGQVATNPSEISKSDCDAHVSDISNNDILGDMSYWSKLSFKKKKSIWDERDHIGIKRPNW